MDLRKTGEGARRWLGGRGAAEAGQLAGRGLGRGELTGGGDNSPDPATTLGSCGPQSHPPVLIPAAEDTQRTMIKEEEAG